MTREEFKLIWLMSYLKMESLQVFRGGPHMRTGIFEEAVKNRRCLPFHLRRGTTCGERWRYPTRATLGRTLAGPEACLMCPVRDASLEWVKKCGNLPVIIGVTVGDVTGHPLWSPDLFGGGLRAI